MVTIRKERKMKVGDASDVGTSTSTSASEATSSAVVEGVASQPAGFRINPEASAQSKDVLRLTLDKDGKIDSSNRPATLDKVRSWFQKQENREALLGKEEKKNKAAETITAKQAERIWSLLGMPVLPSLAVYIAKAPKDIAFVVLPYQVDELEKLGKPTADVLNQYVDVLPAWLIQWLTSVTGPLSELVEVVLQIHFVKYEILKQAMADPERFKEQLQQARAAQAVNGKEVPLQ